MRVRDATFSDLNAISSLHLKALKTASSELGKNYIKENYQSLIFRDENNIILVATEDEKIIGVISTSLDLSRSLRQISRRISLLLVIDILLRLLHKPILILDLLKHAYFEYKLLKIFPAPYVTILTLFVDRNYRRKGVGKKITHVLFKRLKDKVEKLYVDTERNNSRAISFYQALGFKIEKQIGDFLVLRLNLKK